MYVYKARSHQYYRSIVFHSISHGARMYELVGKNMSELLDNCCPICNQSDFAENGDGFTVCGNCGLVFEEKPLANAPTRSECVQNNRGERFQSHSTQIVDDFSYRQRFTTTYRPKYNEKRLSLSTEKMSRRIEAEKIREFNRSNDPFVILKSVFEYINDYLRLHQSRGINELPIAVLFNARDELLRITTMSNIVEEISRMPMAPEDALRVINARLRTHGITISTADLPFAVIRHHIWHLHEFAGALIWRHASQLAPLVGKGLIEEIVGMMVGYTSAIDVDVVNPKLRTNDKIIVNTNDVEDATRLAKASTNVRDFYNALHENNIEYDDGSAPSMNDAIQDLRAKTNILQRSQLQRLSPQERAAQITAQFTQMRIAKIDAFLASQPQDGIWGTMEANKRDEVRDLAIKLMQVYTESRPSSGDEYLIASYCQLASCMLIPNGGIRFFNHLKNQATARKNFVDLAEFFGVVPITPHVQGRLEKFYKRYPERFNNSVFIKSTRVGIIRQVTQFDASCGKPFVPNSIYLADDKSHKIYQMLVDNDYVIVRYIVNNVRHDNRIALSRFRTAMTMLLGRGSALFTRQELLKLGFTHQEEHTFLQAIRVMGVVASPGKGKGYQLTVTDADSLNMEFQSTFITKIDLFTPIKQKTSSPSNTSLCIKTGATLPTTEMVMENCTVPLRAAIEHED